MPHDSCTPTTLLHHRNCPVPKPSLLTLRRTHSSKAIGIPRLAADLQNKFCDSNKIKETSERLTGILPKSSDLNKINKTADRLVGDLKFSNSNDVTDNMERLSGGMKIKLSEVSNAGETSDAWPARLMRHRQSQCNFICNTYSLSTTKDEYFF